MSDPSRPVEFNLADIQGNILTAYGRLGFPKGRNLCFNVRDAAKGCRFIETLVPQVTTALRWRSRKALAVGKLEVPRPKVTLNVALTFEGLYACGVPVRTLRGFPDEFIQGMVARAALLGDDFPASSATKWDPVWLGQGQDAVHLLVMLNADMDPQTGLPVPELEAKTEWLRQLCEDSGGGVAMLRGHGADGKGEWQELSAVLRHVDDQYVATPFEHLGYLDGISDPVFEGQYEAKDEAIRVRGNGKLGADGSWKPLAAGEFLLGYPDESQEIPPGPMPLPFARNGTFMAYRKLEENVEVFKTYLDTEAPRFGAVYGIGDPVAARATLMAKFAGRWADGVPLSLAPTFEDWQRFNNATSNDARAGFALTEYTYWDDPGGVRCPVTSHVRRVNPRDGMGPAPPRSDGPGRSGTVLSNRRRILRRGLPYGTGTPGHPEKTVGIVMLCVCASLFRQFEFVQQQWINYGLDASAGNDTCPLLGNHGPGAKFVVPADPARGHAPFIAANIPQFVDARGGAYFFVPSLPALAMIGTGAIDPT